MNFKIGDRVELIEPSGRCAADPDWYNTGEIVTLHVGFALVRFDDGHENHIALDALDHTEIGYGQ
jgi:hypothetical protein